jgi:preprotein translocase subunit SecG
MIETLVLFGHLVVAALIIALVLLQRGKGAEAGTGFGAGASGTVFGSRGSASFFSRATAFLATLFFATSLTLAYFSTQSGGSGGLLEGSVMEPGVDVIQAPPDDGPALNPATELPGGVFEASDPLLDSGEDGGE